MSTKKKKHQRRKDESMETQPSFAHKNSRLLLAPGSDRTVGFIKLIVKQVSISKVKMPDATRAHS